MRNAGASRHFRLCTCIDIWHDMTVASSGWTNCNLASTPCQNRHLNNVIRQSILADRMVRKLNSNLFSWAGREGKTVSPVQDNVYRLQACHVGDQYEPLPYIFYDALPVSFRYDNPYKYDGLSGWWHTDLEMGFIDLETNKNASRGALELLPPPWSVFPCSLLLGKVAQKE